MAICNTFSGKIFTGSPPVLTLGAGLCLGSGLELKIMLGLEWYLELVCGFINTVYGNGWKSFSDILNKK